jgi:hypothetical protein
VPGRDPAGAFSITQNGIEFCLLFFTVYVDIPDVTALGIAKKQRRRED